MHALDSHLFWFQSPTFPCSKTSHTLLYTCHTLCSTKSNDLQVSESDLMVLICQSNVQAVTKIRHLLENGNAPVTSLSYFTYLSMHPKKPCKASWKTASWQPIRLPKDLLHDLCRSPLQGLRHGVKPHRTGALDPQPQSGKFNTRIPLQSKTNVSSCLQWSVNPYAAFLLRT